MMQAGTGRIELMLLVDGELQGLDAALVGRRCRDDPTIGAAVSELEVERTLLRAAFPVEPGASTPCCRDRRETGGHRARQRRAAFWRIARAACRLDRSRHPDRVHHAAIWPQYRRAVRPRSVLAEQARDRQLMAAAFNTALDTQISGGSVTWQNPASGSRGSITPLRTFRTADGRWCREYGQEIDGRRAVASSGSASPAATREGWRLKLERPWAA